MEIITSSTPAITAGEVLGFKLEKYKNKPALLLLSGGSALSILDYVSETLLGPNLTITALDERFSTDPTINNFSQIKATKFYERVLKRGVSSIDTSVSQNDTLEEVGEYFEKSLREWRAQYPEGIVLATMGIGGDGHTAGIFPGEYPVNFSGPAWVVAYEVPESVNQYTKRITVTYTFLLTQISEAILFVSSTDKLAVIQRIENKPCSLKDTPACIFQSLSNITLVRINAG